MAAAKQEHQVESLCPEHELRAAMTDAEFWDHVFNKPIPDTQDWGPSSIDVDDMELTQGIGTPCPECGARWGACAYDAEGRPMIHAVGPNDD